MLCSKDPNNIGRLFEQKITDSLCALSLFDTVLHEDDLRRQWGWDVCSIDHLLVYKGYYLIPIQEKWCNTRRRETKHMQRFVKSVSYIQKILPNHKILFGVWVSRIDPFDDNKEMLCKHNIFTVSRYTSCMNELISSLISFIHDSLVIMEQKHF